MTRLVKKFRIPRLNVTIVLTVYCLLVVFYISSIPPKKEIIKTKNGLSVELKELPRDSFPQENQVSKIRPSISVTEKEKLLLINESAEDEIYNHPFLPGFPLPGPLKSPKPLFKMGYIDSNSDVIIGIPTVKREREDYLMETLKSLLNDQGTEGLSVNVVVFIGETNLTYIKETSEKINKSFAYHIQLGLLQVISPPVNYYPPWKVAIKAGFNDSFDRVKWRSKQNLDQIFLMMYAYQLSPKYYLMMEDDVIAKKGYAKMLLEEAHYRRDAEYFYIAFCSLGAIGKLFRSATLPPFASFIHLFWNQKPLDWLLMDYVTVGHCSLDEKPQICSIRRNLKLPFVVPALFQHIGTYSSLSGKVQILQDSSFGRRDGVVAF